MFFTLWNHNVWFVFIIICHPIVLRSQLSLLHLFFCCRFCCCCHCRSTVSYCFCNQFYFIWWFFCFTSNTVVLVLWSRLFISLAIFLFCLFLLYFRGFTFDIKLRSGTELDTFENFGHVHVLNEKGGVFFGPLVILTINSNRLDCI